MHCAEHARGTSRLIAEWIRRLRHDNLSQIVKSTIARERKLLENGCRRRE